MLYSEVPKSVKERVEIWKIVLAVLAGIILLALLVFGLYKVSSYFPRPFLYEFSSSFNVDFGMTVHLMIYLLRLPLTLI